MEISIRLLIAVLLTGPGLCLADDTVRQRSEAMVRDTFAGASTEEWNARLRQDEVQAVCSQYRNSPPADIAQRIVTLQQQTLRYPEDGKMMGDWKKGEKLASIGTGGHIGRIQPDRPGTPQGGNCYACHVMASKEVAAGNLGPALTGFGRLRGTSAETIKYTFEKIYNAQAFYPCSMMPRFGHNGWLSMTDIADAVAFLLDPESPVNK